MLIGGIALYVEIGGSAGGELIDLLISELYICRDWRIGWIIRAFYVHCIWMSLYFKDHINHLVRVDPLRNLPLGYLTPSPTRSNSVDLSRFPLVDTEPIPIDQHEQDPLQPDLYSKSVLREKYVCQSLGGT